MRYPREGCWKRTGTSEPINARRASRDRRRGRGQHHDHPLWEARIRNADGSEASLFANAIISAAGFLDRPVFHTSKSNPTLDLSNKRVSLVGTGASGMQMMPDLLPGVGRLNIFQRSPWWVVPIPFHWEPYSEEVRWLHRNLRFSANWTRHIMASAIGDHVIYDIWSVDPNWKEPHTLNEDNFKLRGRLVEHLLTKRRAALQPAG